MTVGISRTFGFSAVDVAGTNDTLTGRWNFGDGTITNVPVGTLVSHAYSAPGDYTVFLRVSDEDGGSMLAAYQVTVDEGMALDVTVLTGGYPGIGGGTFTLAPTAPLKDGVYRYQENQTVTITAVPDANSFFYQWGADVPDALTDSHTVGPGCPLTMSVTMDDDKQVTLLFAQKAQNGTESVLDDDQLGDNWVVQFGLEPTS